MIQPILISKSGGQYKSGYMKKAQQCEKILIIDTDKAKKRWLLRFLL